MAVDHPGLGFSLEQLIRMVRREAVATLQNASIGRAGLRVYDGGWILIEGGGLSVTGKQTVSGMLEGSGTLLWVGPWELRGDGKITGKTQVAGDTTITGKLGVTGNAEFGGNTVIKKDLDVQAKTRLRGKTTLESDLEILPGGKIKVGNMIIDPSIGRGSISFQNGAQVFTDGSTIQMFKGNSVVQVTDGYARLQNGGNVVEINANGFRISPGAIGAVPAGSLPSGVLRIDDSGYLTRTI